MNSETADKFCQILFKYGATAELKLETETRSFNQIGRGMAIDFCVDQLVIANITFSKYNFGSFVKGLETLDTLNDEEYTRNRFPSVQAAYDHYKLLLKLTHD